MVSKPPQGDSGSQGLAGWRGAVGGFGVTLIRRLVADSVNRRIFVSALSVAALTLIVKVAALGRDVLSAAAFGTADAFDAFIIAFVVPSFAASIIANSLSAAFIPTYIEARSSQGTAAAQRLLESVNLATVGAVVAACALLGFTAPWFIPLLATGFSPAKLELTRTLFFLLLPTVAVSTIATLWTAVLNSHERFAFAAIVPAVTPLLSGAFILVGAHTWGVYALALGITSGVALEATFLWWILRKFDVRAIPRWHGYTPEARLVFRQYVPVVAAAVMMGSTLLIDQAMAASLGSGDVATLSYATKIVSVLIVLGSGALSTVILPHFSKFVATKDWTQLRHTLKTYTWLILAVTIPMTLMLGFGSEFLTGLLFERGEFTHADTVKVAWVQAMLVLQLPFYTLGILYVRTISALKGNSLLIGGTIISIILNVVGNVLLMRVMGVAGIGLSTSIVYAVSSIYLLVAVRSLLRKREMGVSPL